MDRANRTRGVECVHERVRVGRWVCRGQRLRGVDGWGSGGGGVEAALQTQPAVTNTTDILIGTGL